MILMIGASVLSLCVCLPLFMYYRKAMRYALGALFKSLSTVCALIPALVAALRLDSQCWFCAVALAFCVIADFLLEFSLYAGAGCFIAGHLMYISFFLRLYPFSVTHVVCLAVLLLFMAGLFWRWRSRMGQKLSFFIVYGLVLCVMTACAVAGGMTAYTLQGTLIALGGALFYVSDVMVCRNLLFPGGRHLPWLTMAVYESAQLLLGISCLFI